MDCHHEHDEHGDHGHDHIAPPDTNQAQTLYPRINHDGVITLNEINSGSGAKILRKYSDRLEHADFCESDVDEELLITIPFTGLVRLHSVLIRSFTDERAPDEIQLFKNRDDLDFSMVNDLKPVQLLSHPEGVGVGTSDNDGIVEYAVNRAHFSNITSLTIHVKSNHGAETTAITYIGLRGEWQQLNRAPVVATYEAAANPADHKNITKNSRRVHESAD